MNILLTNDDGIHAPGLLALYRKFRPNHEVSVAAPEVEQSAVGHAITLADPIRVKEIHNDGEFFGYSVNGTPADCVKLALAELLKTRPDVVISGINLGANVGINLLYSGTVSAATEAAILNLPALAVSLDTFTNPDFSYAAEFTRRLVEKLPEMNIPRRVSLNINIPSVSRSRITKVAWVRQGQTVAGENFIRRKDPRGNVYYWQGQEVLPPDLEEDTDINLLRNGMITHYDELSRLEKYPLTP
ncbi:MAG: 5'/3'-nucleotidase SurE [Deltaproteobacteria bacterium]|nr:5'/3'-nucleotidase SurE [Deltaproteobacteria bacterium]